MATSTPTSRGSDRTPTMAHATVADAMHPGVISCPPETDLTTVARMMATHHIHAVVVDGIRRDARGERLTWGLLSDLDLVAAAQELYGDADAGALAATPIVAVEPQEPLLRAAQLMAENQLAHLLVVTRETGRPVGIVSTLDIAGCLAWGEA